VIAILLATVKDKAFAMYVQGIQDSLPEDKKLTVFEVMALCEIRDGQKKPSDKAITHKLEQMGYIEKHGKTNAIYYILPRRYYELAGDMAAYSLATDWDINQVWAVILPFLQKYGKAKRSDIVKIIGPHLSEKQIRRYLDILKSKGLLKTEGQNRTTIYLLGDSYAANNVLISKALAIGLQELKEKGEI
jgi:ATP-dependent DNA helicase RecG